MRSKLLIGGLGAAVAFLLATSPVVAQAAGFITSGDIVNNTIKSKDVKDNNLKGKDLAANTVTGTEVNEGTLGVVPTASNATNLNGQSASTYLDRVAFAQNPALVNLPASSTPTEVIAPVTLTVQTGVNFVHIIANGSMNNGGGVVAYWVEVDAACGTTSTEYNDRQFSSPQPAGAEDSAVYNYVRGVTAGAHTFRFCARNATTASAIRASTLSVETVAGGRTGTASPRHAASDAR